MGVTEFAYLPLSKDINLAPGNDGHKTMMDSFALIKKQPGCENIYWGTAHDNPSLFIMIIDWTALESHTDFMKREEYEPFKNRLLAALDGQLVLHHAAFRQHPPSSAVGKPAAPATEILTLFFPTDQPQQEQQEFEDRFAGFMSKLQADWKGLRAAVWGWIIEEVDHEKSPSGKAKGFRALLAWDSVQSHEECRSTKTFQDNIHIVRQAPKSYGLSLIHVEAEVYRGS